MGAGPGDRPPSLHHDDQLLTRAAVLLASAIARIWRTSAGSFEVTSASAPPSMLTTSRVTLPLAIAPRMILQPSHRCALSPAATILCSCSERRGIVDWSAGPLPRTPAGETKNTPLFVGTPRTPAPPPLRSASNP